ncbi:hypothetical protein MGYG_05533 [Nannizzia gypsea CBS 118893]|uniref:Uncharacterized protein n=1 Tax=Arthroderma gypseum (strain ATCC MYA-4604 / CBS 118893) TaxID=535722 RepID=E4UWE2_ARTGP|nr:hypothetical protein MGYG_05533 [Nannizzia gypsea CBS 118893]EFR02537.1 hypothetical protein MGYG_05533 [Nannizzia gypsea CBS 118893]
MQRQSTTTRPKATSVTLNRLSTFQSTAAPRTTTAVHPSCHICGLIRSNSARNVNAQRSPHHAAGRMLRARHTSSGIYHRRSTPSITATRGCSLFVVTSLGTGISSVRLGEGGMLVDVEWRVEGDVIEDDNAADRREWFDMASTGSSESKEGLKGAFRLRRPETRALRLRVRGGWRGGKEGILRVDASLNSRHRSRYPSCLKWRSIILCNRELDGYWEYRGSFLCCFSRRGVALVFVSPQSPISLEASRIGLDRAEEVEVVSTAVPLGRGDCVLKCCREYTMSDILPAKHSLISVPQNRRA